MTTPPTPPSRATRGMTEDGIYTPEQVAAYFHTKTAFWLRKGVREHRFPCLRIGSPRNGQIRFTPEHIKAIKAELEQPVRRRVVLEAPLTDISALGATSRSTAHHQKTRSA